MNNFVLCIQESTRHEEIEGVSSFVGEDSSGSFGILPNHARFMTSLVVGLARFRCGSEPWRYVAMPGAILYFCANRLTLSTRRYLIDDNYTRISIDLRDQLLAEEDSLLAIKSSLHNMEDAVLKRMWQIRHAQS